jgi:hypothetical protein
MPAPPRRRWHRFSRGTMIALGVALVCATALVLSSARFRIGYHNWAMQRSWDAVYVEPDTVTNGLAGYSLDELRDRYAHHRQRLVELGAVNQRIYVFK